MLILYGVHTEYIRTSNKYEWKKEIGKKGKRNEIHGLYVE